MGSLEEEDDTKFTGFKMKMGSPPGGSLEEEDDTGAYSSLLPWELGSFEDDYADFEPEDTCINLNLHIIEAKVTGFATQKYEKGDRPTDFAFVIEVLWSDGRSSVVKRTFTEFCNFHNYLVDEFTHICPRENPMKLTLFLPARDLDEGDIIEVTESRELELDQYVQELLKLTPRVSASATVLTFFESRNSDPQPYNEETEASQSPQPNNYVLCWVGDSS